MQICHTVIRMKDVHNTIVAGPLHTARGVARNLHVPKTAALKILRSVLWMFIIVSSALRCCNLKTSNSVSIL